MHTSNARQIALSLLIGLAVAVGCSDASATEGTYLPIHEQCPHEVADDHHESTVPGLEKTVIDGDRVSGDDGDAPDEKWDEPESDTDDFTSERPFSRSALHMGPTPEAAPASNPVDDDSSSGSDAADETIDINSADADELTELTGIGPALADRIVDYRRQRDFDDPAHLQRIEGIGPATYDEIASEIDVE